MRDHAKDRSGRDRWLLTVAATLLTVAGSAAYAQSESTAANDAARIVDSAIEASTKPAVAPTENSSSADTAQAPASATPSADTAAAPASTDAAAGTAEPAPAEKAAADTPPASPAPATAAAETPAAPAETVTKETTIKDTVAEPVKQASTVDAADQPVADKLRDMIAAKTVRFDKKNEAAAVEAFYKARDFAPIWSKAGAADARAKAVISRLQDAASEGLDAREYPVPDFAAATSPDALAEAELRLTKSVLDYARQAQGGRMHFSQVGADILYPANAPDPAAVLAAMSTASDASAALAAYNPPQPGYRALKAKLAELRGKTEGPKAVPIAEGALLRPAASTAAAMEDPRVPQIRARLGVGNESDTRYDSEVADAVRKFQREHGLAADGVLGSRTIDVMNGPRRDNQINTVLVNMERWRWLPRDLGAAKLGDAYVMLNIPDFTLKLKQGESTVWKTRVVVGKPGKHATPLLTETMKYITVNPTWNVPPSIVYNEYLPALQQDPSVLDRMGMKLVQRADGSVHISQPPGERNALGRIRFNFPNKFLVYQHDTPDKNLFSKDVRAYSHGCMRVQYPDQYASHLLSIALPQQNYTVEKIHSMYGSGEVNINLPTPIPVHLTYQTAFADDAGHIEFRSDIYGIDRKMISLLEGNKNLEAVVAHAQPNYSRPRVTLPQGMASNERGGMPGFGGGSNFLEALFGGFARPVPPAPIDRRQIYTR